LIGVVVSGMGFALNEALVDATSGRPQVVTLGVREQVVKPATRSAGLFTMGRINQSPIDAKTPRAGRLPQLPLLATGCAGALLVLAGLPAYAGTASAQFGVTARVVKSCKVSGDALAAQSAIAGGTINVNCQDSASASGSSSGVARPSGMTNVNYSIDEVSGSGGAVKILTVNY
jgi:hypothetical protein